MAKKRTDIRTEKQTATINKHSTGSSRVCPGAPISTSPVPSYSRTQTRSSWRAAQERVVTPAPPGPASPTLPRRTFQEEGCITHHQLHLKNGGKLRKGCNLMKKRKYSFSKILVFCLMSGMTVCFGNRIFRSRTERRCFLGVQDSSSQPRILRQTHLPTAPQPSSTQQAPASPQPPNSEGTQTPPGLNSATQASPVSQTPLPHQKALFLHFDDRRHLLHTVLLIHQFFKEGACLL